MFYTNSECTTFQGKVSNIRLSNNEIGSYLQNKQLLGTLYISKSNKFNPFYFYEERG